MTAAGRGSTVVAVPDQVCTFRVDDLFLGIAVEQVQELLRPQPMTPVPRAPDAVRGLINLRGQIVAAVDLRRRLGLSPGGPEERLNVVVTSDDEVVSLLVDDIGDVLDIRGATAEPVPATLPGPVREVVSGALPLPGSILLLVDADRAIEVPPAEPARADAPQPHPADGGNP